MSPPASSPPALPDPLPPGAVLAHVGVHKTGTTAIQSVLTQQRSVLEGHGVVYPGRNSNHHKAAMALTGTKWGRVEKDGRPIPPRHWSDLVHEVQHTDKRVVVSSEFFGDTRDPHGERLRDDLGKDRLHVVIGIRPLPHVLASAWQQTLKLGRHSTFDEWLQKVYLGAPTANPRGFWGRYDYGGAVRRWSDWVGHDQVSVIVLDDQDHSWQPRVFESLLDLPAGVIDGVSPGRSNRSLTAPEAAAIRRANEMMDKHVDWLIYEPLIRNGAIVAMVENRTPDPGEPRIATPDWAVQHAVEQGGRAADEIADSGVRVLGRLELLGQVPERMAANPLTAEEATAINEPGAVPLEAFAQAVAGTVAGALRHGVRPIGDLGADAQLVKDTTAKDLLGVVARRTKRRLNRRSGS
jgi:hypothetical protein